MEIELQWKTNGKSHVPSNGTNINDLERICQLHKSSMCYYFIQKKSALILLGSQHDAALSVLGRWQQILIYSPYAVPAAINQNLPPASELRQTSCTSLTLCGTDRQRDTIPLHRRSLLEADSVSSQKG